MDEQDKRSQDDVLKKLALQRQQNKKPLDLSNPFDSMVYNLRMAESDENERKSEQIKKDIDLATENKPLPPEVVERLQLEREGDPIQRERFKNLRKAVLEKKYPGYKLP